MTRIEHRGLGGAVLLALDYIYTANDLPVRIYESGSTVGTGITISTTFVYDRLRRLKEEQRCRGTTSCDLLYYDLEYWYDAGGNRIQKIDYDNGGVVYYTYDIAHPSLYGSNNNRLMKAETRDGDGSTVATTWYYYTAAGNVRWIVSDPPAGGGVQQQYMMGGGGGGGEGEDPLVEAEVAEGEATEPASLQTTDGSGGGMSMLTGGGGGCVGTTKYTATRFEYAKNGQTVTYVLGEEWCWDRNPEHCPDPGTYKVLWAREFRYDGARARYMNAPLDPATLAPYNATQKPTIWSDYDGDEAYGDFTVSTANPPVVSNTGAYEPGLWRKVGTASEYLHSDMLGTLRLTTNTSGGAGASRVFTAFGERLPGSATDRFGYVGAWGYQDTLDSATGAEVFPYLHVGARYYDPSSGRFLQRDPIGVAGGLNVYLDVGANPLRFVDPSGLDWIDVVLEPLVGVVGPENVLGATGGQGHVPVLGPGTAQDVVQIGTEIVSVAAPIGATYKTITATAKTVRALKATKIGRFIQKLRKYIRYDPAHHGKPPHWDGKIPNALGCGE